MNVFKRESDVSVIVVLEEMTTVKNEFQISSGMLWLSLFSSLLWFGLLPCMENEFNLFVLTET